MKYNHKFWAVYNNRDRAIAISSTKDGAIVGALDISKYRWNDQTKDETWKYLQADGWYLEKSIITPIKEAIND